jgi:hypothetical protein
VPKVRRGRLSGVYGMAPHLASELLDWANRVEGQIEDPNNRDDARWLQRRVNKLRALAVAKEKAKEQKDKERKLSRTRPTSRSTRSRAKTRAPG